MPLPIRALHPTSSLHQNTFGSRRELTSSIPSRPSPHAAHRIAVLPSFVASSIVPPSVTPRPSPPWSPRSHRPPIIKELESATASSIGILDRAFHALVTGDAPSVPALR